MPRPRLTDTAGRRDLRRDDAPSGGRIVVWTEDHLRALTNADGTDYQCPACGASVRRALRVGGPHNVPGWTFRNGRWVHNPCD